MKFKAIILLVMMCSVATALTPEQKERNRLRAAKKKADTIAAKQYFAAQRRQIRARNASKHAAIRMQWLMYSTQNAYRTHINKQNMNRPSYLHLRTGQIIRGR